LPFSIITAEKDISTFNIIIETINFIQRVQ